MSGDETKDGEAVEALCRRLVRFPDPSCMGGVKKGEGRKGLVNNWTPKRTHGCIPAVNVDEGKRECQVGVSCEYFLCECIVWTHGFKFQCGMMNLYLWLCNEQLLNYGYFITT